MSPHLILFRLLGLTLLAAAVLKLHGLAVEPVQPMGFFSSPAVRFGLVEIEFVLGCWFLFARELVGPWLVAFAIFCVFSAVSVHYAIIGEASCGCAGRIKINPRWTLLFDIACLAGLLFVRPAVFRSNSSSWKAAISPVATPLFTSGCIFGLLAVLAVVSFGSVSAALAHLQGNSISLSPSLVDVGTAPAGAEARQSVALHNWTGEPIRVVGGTSDCSCVTTADLPVVVPAHGSRSISISIRMPAASGIFTRNADLFAEVNGFLRPIRFRLAGESVKNSFSALE